jgi:hypothetical protein
MSLDRSTAGCANKHRRGNAENLMRDNLMIWSAAIYCTPVARDSLVVSLR